MENNVLNNHAQERAQIMKGIASISRSEKIVRGRLAELSRSILDYIVVKESPDVGVINRLLQVLSPMNKKTAVLYFQHFIPHAYKEETKEFGKKLSPKKVEEIQVRVKDFLANEENSIWTWADDNIKLEKKPVDYTDKLTRLVTKALSDPQANLDSIDILSAVIKGGVTLEELFEAATLLQENEKVAA